VDYIDIRQGIRALDEDQLVALHADVVGQIKSLRNQRARLNRNSFGVGDLVSWSSRRGSFSGQITKVKRKYAFVMVGPVRWNVPLSMLVKE